MSSPAYSSRLQPDPRLRLGVSVSGQIFRFIGLIIILTLETVSVLQVLCACSWWLWVRIEIGRLQRGFANCCAIRVNLDLSIEVLNSEMECIPARLLGGSVVLPRLAWIRYETDTGERAAEWLIGDCRKSDDWRRLQVIWHFVGAGR